MNVKKILFTSHKFIDHQQIDQIFELPMACIAFGQDVSLAFSNDAVFTLCQATFPDAIDADLFENVWVEEEALHERGLAGKPLALNSQPVKRHILRQRLNSIDLILTL